MITIVTGGARSGKSEFAENLIKDSAIYIATAESFDAEMDLRIKKHIKRRDESSISWRTVECFRDFNNLDGDEKYVLFDSLGVFVSNVMFSETFKDLSDENIKKVMDIIRRELKKLFTWARFNDKELVIVTDEVGMSIVPENKLSRVFRDILGTINKEVALKSDRAYLICMGLEVKLK